MSTPKFAETYNLVVFFEKPEESNGFEGIIDFLNASSIKYALTVNPTVYESCIRQFWETAKAKTVNKEHQIQALVEKKKVIITEKSGENDLKLEYAEGTECPPNDSQFLNNSTHRCSCTNKLKECPNIKGFMLHLSHTKKILLKKREGKGFSGRITPLFQTMMVQAPKDMGAQGGCILTGEKIADLDTDVEVTLRFVVEKDVSATDPVTTAGEVVTTASATTTVDEPKAKGIIFHDQEEQASAFTPIVSSSQLP
ncbi:hypothetical protein Tco_0104300 [Tanacetum coccineum]